MTDFPPLPEQTMSDLAQILRYFALRVWNASKAFFQMIAPFVQPPEDMTVRTRDGRQYTGALVIEENEILAGAVVPVGHEHPRHDPFSGTQRPWSSTEREPPRSSALTHWAHDPRENPDDEVPPWLR